MNPSSLTDHFVHYALNHSRHITRTIYIISAFVILLAILPNFIAMPLLKPITVDTDPENMLSEQAPVRQLHHQNKTVFSLSDMVVVGIENNQHPQGVFNAQTLQRIYDLTEFARQLHWQDDSTQTQEGVIEIDMIAPSMVDNIEQQGLGAVQFSWLMATPPDTDQQALALLEKAQRLPLLNGTMVSDTGKAIALYLPLTSKKASYRVREALLAHTADWPEQDKLHITGLPVAEDTFGVEMFIQMAISAPLAMLVIFGLLFYFFKHTILIISPMIVAMISSLVTMALLIISGYTIHIMSSMIPIFVMPIAVLDSVHILSEFFDRYSSYNNKRDTLKHVMQTLFKPMLFTTLTTVAGFASLVLAPVPPVQVFGIFVAIGVALAWLLTILFIPAYLMMIPEQTLAGYGRPNTETDTDRSLMSRILTLIGRSSTQRPKSIIFSAFILAIVSVYGIIGIIINDNPVKWFEEEHPIRVADRFFNDNFAGSYMAYLSLKSQQTDTPFDANALQQQVDAILTPTDTESIAALALFRQHLDQLATQSLSSISAIQQLTDFSQQQMAKAEGDDYYIWDALLLTLDTLRQRNEVFKQPATLQWMNDLQHYIASDPYVGKVNALTDIVKTVHRELLLGDPAAFTIPSTTNAIGQTLLTYQNSHRPHDLWHFVTPDYTHANLWVQLTSGDNKNMATIVDNVEQFISTNPPPTAIDAQWFGLTYVNVVWQEKMVSGMLNAFMGSFIVVLLMMIFLFRSVVFGLLSMVPLTLTVGFIYGLIGLMDKDYDMPIAVLSSLSLGLAIDYAIHFIARSRELVSQYGSWAKATPALFGDPARAISRNVIILSIGFLPLLAAPLVPYQTVGLFIALIMFSAGIATLFLLPALMTLLQRHLFKQGDKH